MEKYNIPANMKEHARKLNLLDRISDENIEHLMMVWFGAMAISMIEKDPFVSPVVFMQAVGLSENRIVKIHEALTKQAHNLLEK